MGGGSASASNMDMSAGDLISKVSITAKQDMDSLKQAGRAALLQALCSCCCALAIWLQGSACKPCWRSTLGCVAALMWMCQSGPAAGSNGSLDRVRCLRCSLYPQMASQAGSKLSRMAQSFMRDLQGGY